MLCLHSSFPREESRCFYQERKESPEALLNTVILRIYGLFQYILEILRLPCSSVVNSPWIEQTLLMKGIQHNAIEMG